MGPCLSRTSCAAFLLSSLAWYLHGDHEYYVSVRAENGAGLATVGTSPVYRHIVQLPSKGVVLDVAPPGEEAMVDLGVCMNKVVVVAAQALVSQNAGSQMICVKCDS